MTITAATGIWTIGVNWPYPQMIFTSYYNLAVAIKSDGKLALYELTNTSNVWTAVEKVVLGIATNIKSVSVADFSTYYMLSIEEYITNIPDHNLYGKNVSTDAVTLIDISLPAAATCCNFQGQLILGQLLSGDSPWKELSPCSVAWSDIGSIDMNPEDYVVAGFAVMPWDENGNGKVYKVLPLGKGVRVYGDKGICNLIPYTVERVVGFGVGELETPGILSADAIAGDETVHGYVDSNYDFWITDGEKAKNLGYRKQMLTLTNRILVRYDPQNKRFYISDGVLCYIYNQHGMYSSHQCTSSVGNYKNVLCGFFKNNSDTKIRIASNPTDFGVQGNKTIESVEAGVTYDTTADEVMTGSIATKYDYKGDFIQLDYTQLNDRGIFTQKMTGREFKIFLQADYESGAEFSLSSLMAKIKFSDKRNIRGRLNVN